MSVPNGDDAHVPTQLFTAPPLCLMQSLERRMLFDATVCDSPVQDPAVAEADVALLNNQPPSNQPPVLTVNNSSVSGNEGSYATHSGTVSDPNFDFVTLSASLGSVSNNSGNWTWSYMAPDGHVPPVTQTVTITADDGRGGTSQASFSLTVNNVSPTLTLSGPAEVRTGVAFQVGRSVSDPGQDTIASWTVNWGDGTPVETFPGNPLSFSHVYAAPGTFSVSATATDEDGTFSSNTLQVLAKELTIDAEDVTITVTPTSAKGSGKITASDGIARTGYKIKKITPLLGGGGTSDLTISNQQESTGGTTLVEYEYKPGVAPPTTRTYSVEVFWVDNTDVTDTITITVK